MKIGIIKHRYASHGGGSERYTNGLISGLLKLGHEVHVFAGHVSPQTDRNSVTVHPVPVPGGPAFFRQLFFAPACKMVAQKARCDLLFSLERTMYQDIARAGGGCHREYLAQRRRYYSWPKRFAFQLNLLHPALLHLETKTFHPNNTRVVIANSLRGKIEIAKHYGFPAGRVEVIHNGVDCQQFRPRQHWDGDSVVLLFVGSGFERKGLQFAIRALAHLPRKVELRVAGKGNEAAYLRLARTLDVSERVRFLGVQNRIEDVYGQGDVLVHPAIYEPFSNACLEAMACGLPVVTSRMNGAAEVIQHGQNGAVVENPGEIAALAEAIGLFLNPKRRQEAGAHARNTAETLPLSLNVERTLEVIKRVAAER